MATHLVNGIAGTGLFILYLAHRKNLPHRHFTVREENNLEGDVEMDSSEKLGHENPILFHRKAGRCQYKKRY